MSQLCALFVIDPPERLDPPTDTSLALMRESLRRGQRVVYCTPADLSLRGGSLRARVRAVEFPQLGEMFVAGGAEEIDPEALDLLYMRKDPPVDEAYLHATYLLDFLPERVVQVNPAAALRNHCEKLSPLRFPGLAPETLVSCRVEELESFLAREGRVVVKPLDECSGRGIFVLNRGDAGVGERLDGATVGGGRFVQAQAFLPEIREGDTRVLLLEGEILGWVRRVPARGDFRSNINAGGHCIPCELTEGQRKVCARLAPWLRREGILLAGIDLVGERLLEVNITSPSCLREINDLTGARLEVQILDRLETLCRGRG